MFERAGGFKPGHHVSVVGAGPIGLARAAGAGLVAAFEVSEVRRWLAAEMRGDFVYDPREVDVGEVLVELSKGQGFDFHVEYGGQGHLGHGTFPNVIRMVAAGRLDLSPIVTARYGLEATKEAIAKSMERTDGKISVKPN